MVWWLIYSFVYLPILVAYRACLFGLYVVAYVVNAIARRVLR